MARFTGSFVTRDLPGGEDVWEIVEAYSFIDDDGQEYPVPAGTITDGASIPRFLWPLVGHPRETDIGQAAGGHDLDYREGRGTRAACDRRIIRGMKVLGAPAWKRHLVWAGLRSFGWRAWNHYRNRQIIHVDP